MKIMNLSVRDQSADFLIARARNTRNAGLYIKWEVHVRENIHGQTELEHEVWRSKHAGYSNMRFSEFEAAYAYYVKQSADMVQAVLRGMNRSQKEGANWLQDISNKLLIWKASFGDKDTEAVVEIQLAGELRIRFFHGEEKEQSVISILLGDAVCHILCHSIEEMKQKWTEIMEHPEIKQRVTRYHAYCLDQSCALLQLEKEDLIANVRD